MKKLLYTTAIAGAVLSYGVVAQAETKITGNLALSFNDARDDKTGGTGSSWRNFGKESQINISNGGDLNNGWKYKAGFSIEMDGNDGAATSGGNVTAAKIAGQQDENVYIDFISGNTTISVGMDHFQNTDVHLSNIVGFGYINAAGASQNAASLYPRSNNVTAYNLGYGVGLAQKTDAGSIGVYYTPGFGMAGNDNADVATNEAGSGGTGGRAYELNFIGNLGVNGLNVVAGKLWRDAPGAANGDKDGKRLAASYKYGKFTVAADDSSYSTGTDTQDGRSYGVAYALTDNLSLGATIATAKTTASGKVDEKTEMLALGYNLGAVSVQAQVKNVKALGGTSGNDGQISGVYLNTKF